MEVSVGVSSSVSSSRNLFLVLMAGVDDVGRGEGVIRKGRGAEEIDRAGSIVLGSFALATSTYLRVAGRVTARTWDFAY